jgi:ribosome-binding factor A
MPGPAKARAETHHTSARRSQGRRQQRVSDQIEIEIADMLEKQLEDPRLVGLSVTGVEISPDLRQAIVYVSSLAGQAGSQEALAGLEHARGFLRRELAGRLKLRVTPNLSFRWDASLETGDRISRLLDSLGPLEEASPICTDDGPSP